MTIEFDFSGGAYTPPAGNALEFNFGSSVPTDVEVALTLPGPQVAVVFGGRVDVEAVAVLPGPTLSAKVAPTISLLFAQDPATNGDLVFSLGGADEEVVPGTELSVALTLPLPTVSAQIIPPVEVEVAAVLPPPVLQVEARYVYLAETFIVLPGPQVDCEALYKSNTQRPTVGKVQSFSQVARPESGGATHRMQDGAPHPQGWGTDWQAATDSRSAINCKQPSVLQPSTVERGSEFQNATPERLASKALHQEAERSVRKLLNSAFEEASKLTSKVGFRHQDADRQVRGWRESPWQEARGLRLWHEADFDAASQVLKGLGSRFQEAVPPPPGITVIIIPEPPEVLPCYTPSSQILFEALFGSSPYLLFSCGGTEPPPTPNVPIRKVYFIVNSISMKRVSDNEPIEILGASISTDNRSWAWSLSGTIPYFELEKVEPTGAGPVEVEVEINSVKWRFIVETYDEKKEFAKTAVSITGRSLTAYLDDPYAPARSYVQTVQMTSRQFADGELARPDLITGFDLDWMFPDTLGWDMPAGTWSYNGLTPMAAITQLVQGAGGYVNSRRTAKTLIVRPDYKVPFWEWDAQTPDLILPKTLIRTQSLRWNEKPLYDGVYVTGENTGVTALVRKAGTMGAYLAPAFTGTMISHETAARMKGVSILSSGGKQATMGLELPMEASVGLMSPGLLVEVVNAGYGTEPAWRGLVRSTSIEARRDKKSLTVSQSVELERHYGGF